MKPIHKLSGTICVTCRTIISQKPTDDLLCTKCQNEALRLLLDVVTEDIETTDILTKVSEFLKEVEE